MLLLHGIKVPPNDTIVFIDKNPKNICIKNIRVASVAERSFRSKLASNNKTGYKNVSFSAKLNKFESRVDGLNKQLSKRFHTLYEAVAYSYKIRDEIAGEFAYDGVSNTNNLMPSIALCTAQELEIRAKALKENQMEETTVIPVLPTKTGEPQRAARMDVVANIRLCTLMLDEYNKSGKTDREFAAYAASKLAIEGLTGAAVAARRNTLKIAANTTGGPATANKEIQQLINMQKEMHRRMDELVFEVNFIKTKLKDIL